MIRTTKGRAGPGLELIILLASFLALIWLSLNRFIAPDEGFYLLAARLVMQGQILYDDFFYPQMPLFPYLFGGWLELFGYSWEQARIFAALLSFGCLGLVYLLLRKLTHTALALVGLALFLGSGLVIGWFPTAKTYHASTLFCLLSYIVLRRELFSPHPALFFLSGMSIGLAVNCRLFYAILIPILMIWIVAQKGQRKDRMWHLAYFLFGGLLTLLPHLYFAISDFASYWFNNLGYHRMRSEMGAEQIQEHRRFIFEVALGLRTEARSDGYQLFILCLGSFAHAILRAIRKTPPDMAFWIGMVLFFVSFLPVPIHLQYFVVSIPFFVICSLLFLFEMKDWFLARPWRKAILSLFGGLLLLLYFSSTPYAVKRYTSSGYGVHGVEAGREVASRIKTVKEVSLKIDSLTEPGEIILSQWPGYIFSSRAMPYPGTENQFWVRVGDRISHEERQQYRIVNRHEFMEALKDPALNIVVIEQDRERRYFPRGALERASFERIQDIHGIYIYQRKHDEQ